MFALDVWTWGSDPIYSDADTSSPVEVATIYLSDDGTLPLVDPANVSLSLSGKNADLFSIVAQPFSDTFYSLQLKVGVQLENYESSVLEVSIDADDPDLAGAPDASTQHFVTVSPPLPPEVLRVTPLAENLTPEQLVAALIGPGIQVSNVQFTGTEDSAGFFDGGLFAGIGIPGGVILGSGNVKDASSINTDDGITGDLGIDGDPDLDALIPGYTTNDATILEFDITVAEDNLGIQYVFASDEYNEFVGSSFNDVFAFFVDGENIALVPNAETPTPVSINNVNLESHPIFYRSNDPSDYEGYPPFPFQADGFTSVLQAAVELSPGTHHLKLAIADAGDRSLDSWVFLAAGGIASGATDLSITASASQDLIQIGDQVTYTYTVTNNSGATAENVLLDDLVPQNLIVTSVTSTRGSATLTNGLATVSAGNLPPGKSFTVAITATATAGGIYVHGARVQSSFIDLNIADNIAPVSTIVEPKLAAIYENSGSNQAVGTFSVFDLLGELSRGSGTTYAVTGNDAQSVKFDNNDGTGVFTLLENPDYEIKKAYSFALQVTLPGVDSPREIPLAIQVKNLDEVAPTITSPATAQAIEENSGAFQPVYRVIATDSGDISAGIRFSLAEKDQGNFLINPSSGLVRLAANPDYEKNASFTFTVIATDYAGNSSSKEITLPVTDLDDVPPVFTSLTTATVTENSGSNQVVYQATATDDLHSFSFSLGGTDASDFGIDGDTGEVRLQHDPDYEAKASYEFEVIATNSASNSSKLSVTLVVENVDDTAPTITSSLTPSTIDENSGAGNVVYVITADDSADISEGVRFSVTGSDSSLVQVDEVSGAITLIGDPDYEAKSGYSLTIVATDLANNQTTESLSLTIQNLDEQPPVITSSDTAGPIAENSDVGTPVYTIVADDSADVSASIAYGIAGTDADAFAVNSLTGAVSFRNSPDFELKSSYSILVTAVDGAGNSSDKTVVITVSDVDDTAPVFTSGATASPIAENSGAGQVVYTAATTDAGTVKYSITGPDAGSFTVDEDTGALTLDSDPDFEAKSSYGLKIEAIDDTGNKSRVDLFVPIINIDEIAPVFSSPATAAPVREETLANQVVYIAAVDDSADISAGVTFSIVPGADSAKFDIDAGTGRLRLTESPDYETQQTYTVTVRAEDGAGNQTDHTVLIPVADIDDTRPTIAITAAVSTLTAGESTTVYFNLSEPSADFTADDIFVSGGVLSAFRGSGVTYRGTVTANQEFDGDLTVRVFGERFSDLAGNKVANDTFLVPAVDVVWAPEIIITTGRSVLSGNQKAGVVFQLNKSVSDFDGTDVTTTGGILSNYRGNGRRYTAVFEPTSDFEGTATIEIAAGAFVDLEGIGNKAAALAAPITVDVKAPELTISTDSAVLKKGETATLTFTFTEEIVGFEARDIGVRGGKIEDFVQVSSTVYTATFVPRDNWSGATRIVVGGRRFADLHGNKSAARELLPPIQVDTRVPRVAVKARPASVGLGQSTNLTFVVTGAGAAASGDFTDDMIEVSAGEISQFRARRTSAKRSVFTAVYTAPDSSDGVETITVPSGAFVVGSNPNSNQEGHLEITVDATRPTLEIIADSECLGVGDYAEITFAISEAVQRRTFRSNDVQVVGGRLQQLRAAGRAGDTYTARFVPFPEFEGVATISVASDRFTDAAGLGNEASNLLQITVDTKAPPVPGSVTLQNDTGVSATDLFTSNADIVVDGTLIEVGDDMSGAFEFSFDNQTTWTSIYSPQIGGNIVHVRSVETACVPTVNLPVPPDTVDCGELSASGGVGFTEFFLSLDPQGGIVVVEFTASAIPDKAELIWNGNKVATTSMDPDGNFGPFDDDDETDTAADQYIGSGKGEVPDRIAQFQSDTGVEGYTLGGFYQQVVWWKYTPQDYWDSPVVTLRAGGPDPFTYWAANRVCNIISPSWPPPMAPTEAGMPLVKNVSAAKALAFTYLANGPVIESVLPPPRSNGLPAGAFIDFEIRFNRRVTVAGEGKPFIELRGFAGDIARKAELLEQPAGDRLRFRYLVKPGDQAPQGIDIVPDLKLPPGTTLTDLAGNPAESLNFVFPTIPPKVIVNA